MISSRRQTLGWLTLASAQVAAQLAAQPVPPQDALLPFADYLPEFRIDAQARSPHVKVLDFRQLRDWQTPADQFFTFHQTQQPPQVDLSAWRFAVTGSVANSISLSFDDILQMPAAELPVTIECSGNSSQPRLMNGLVSNGVWRGPLLAPLLGRCGVLPEAREVVFFGADTERERKWPAGGREFTAPHGRSLFVQDALESGAMLATHLNGEPLSQAQGFPLRVIVPGWYGMANVKWLHRILVLDRRYEGQHMSRNYHAVRQAGENDPLVVETSIARNRLKSVVARVVRKSVAGLPTYEVSGAAWGGPHPIVRVELRIDDHPWQTAQIDRQGSPHAWTLWRSPWEAATPGRHTLVSRAIDAKGNVQPERETLQQRQFSAREDHAQWPRLIDIP